MATVALMLLLAPDVFGSSVWWFICWFGILWAFRGLTVPRRWKYGLPTVQILPMRIRLVTFAGEEWSINYGEIAAVEERLLGWTAQLFLSTTPVEKGFSRLRTVVATLKTTGK